MHDTATYHDGERAVQARTGALERLAAIGPRVVRDYMPDQHRELFEKLPTLLLGGVGTVTACVVVDDLLRRRRKRREESSADVRSRDVEHVST